MQQGADLGRGQRHHDVIDAQRIADRIGETDRRRHTVAFRRALGAERRKW